MNRRMLLALIAPLLLGAATAPSLEQGRVSGRVIDRSGAPLSDVQVYMVGDRIGSLSRASGVFLMINVPAGTYEIRAERLGFTIDSRLITVEEGATVEVNFELSQQAIGMREIRSDGALGAVYSSDRPAPLRPAGPPRAAQGGPSFTPMSVKPEVMNLPEIQAAMAAVYTPDIRGVGVAGTVILWFYVGVDGNVQKVQVNSVKAVGSEATLTRMALEVANGVRFSPPFNYDQKVAAWVQVPLTFVP
jgi:TonB family protein